MLKRFLPKSDFTKNVLTLMTGTSVAQALPIAISPILTRIYTPEDFGVLALFTSLTFILGSIANGRYEAAIILPKEDDDALNIAALGTMISTALSLLLLIIIFFLSGRIAHAIGNDSVRPWLYLLPFSVFMTGLYNVLVFYNTRKKRFRDIAKASVLKSFILVIIQLLGGFIWTGVVGLISGQFISQLFANRRLYLNSVKNKNKSAVTFQKMKKLAIRYKDFPKFSFWAVLSNSLSMYLINIMISLFYGIATLGFYSHVQKVLGMPSMLIGSSIGQVFYQEANAERQKTGQAVISFNSTFKKLLIITPVFVIIYFFVEDAFTFVFGDTWRVTGEYAKILTPLYAIRFVSSALSTVISIFEKNKIGLIINILLFIGASTVIYCSYKMDASFKDALWVLSGVLSLLYLGFLLVYKQVAKGSEYEVIE